MRTDIFSNCFEYKFITKINVDQNLNVPELFYTFKSFKSGKTYHVHVEIHPNHFYGVKYHLKEHKNNPNKYNIQTNLYEARQILFTCIRIMLDVNDKDICSSFGFIGSNTILSMGAEGDFEKTDEPKSNTKRFRVYRRLMMTFFDERTFEHFDNEEYSAYMLVRQSELATNPNLITEISKYFSDQYSNFE